MASPRDPVRRSSAGRLPLGVLLVVGVLLAIPVLALLLVNTYAKHGPQLWGFPFFYWYQLLWVFLAAGFTSTAYVLVTRARRNSGGGR